MNSFPRIGARCYNFEPRELPSNSYITYIQGTYGKFAPFIIHGEGGFGEHKQLNWTNLFLLNKLGHHGVDDEFIDEINREKDPQKIEKMIRRLPAEIARYLEGRECKEQVEFLNGLRSNMDTKMHDVKVQVRELREEVKEMKRAMKEILDALDRMERRRDPYCRP
uniref:Uncharacterized protein n=1 Tax=Oryza punctata TaxID=4537 RepID=A0A0E0MHS6_ORYPU